MNAYLLLRTLPVAAFLLAGLSACGPNPTNLANPTVKGDRSTIQGDAKATQYQKATPE
ncbi:MAG: hypothetical protein U1E70_18925 [Acetobacteraceae bacterium]|nr:hypothetical protein [Pseudomonadota bacterium]